MNYKKASTYYFIGNLFNKGVAFLTVPIFTRILSNSEYGVVSTYNSWIGILAMFMGFALHTGIRMAFVDYKDKYDDYMSVTAFFTVISSAVIYVIVILGAYLFGFKSNLLMIGLCLMQSAASALTTDYLYYLMMKYQYKLRTALMVLPSLVSILISIMVIMFVCNENKYWGRIIPTALVTTFFAVVVLILIFRKSRVLWNKEYISYGLKLSAPLILHGIALDILSQSDRTMITLFVNSSQTGIYSLIYNFSMVATVITTSLEGVWVPWFIRKMEEGKQQNAINKIAKDYINLMTYAMVCLTLVAPEIVKFLADSSYWGGISIVPPVVLSNFVIFAYTLYVNIEHYYKKTTNITINTVIAAATNLVLNFIFIPKYGYVAAAYTTLAAYLVSFILHASYAKKMEKELYPFNYFIRSIVHLAVTCILFYMFEEEWWVRWSSAIIYFFAMFFRERNRIFELFPSIEQRIRRKK